MAKTFSNEQLSAINTRDRTLLVSAAAGSGKTTTLTERIIRSLLDEDHPESLENMLIVTFTNAAVEELRDRISKAVKRAAHTREAVFYPLGGEGCIFCRGGNVARGGGGASVLAHKRESSGRAL